VDLGLGALFKDVAKTTTRSQEGGKVKKALDNRIAIRRIHTGQKYEKAKVFLTGKLE